MDQLSHVVNCGLTLYKLNHSWSAVLSSSAFFDANSVIKLSHSTASLTERPSIETNSFVFNGLDYSFSHFEDARTYCCIHVHQSFANFGSKI
mmetsp:Transcript_25001/g.50531  ORF Transcript_25001/g.50531 Transcript_25001/m.50531 type:complete len:92 (+) Transcript_25001:123-398(+)